MGGAACVNEPGTNLECTHRGGMYRKKSWRNGPDSYPILFADYFQPVLEPYIGILFHDQQNARFLSSLDSVEQCLPNRLFPFGCELNLNSIFICQAINATLVVQDVLCNAAVIIAPLILIICFRVDVSGKDYP